MIVGLGVDLAPVADIERLYTRHEARFLDRVFTRAEQDYCLGRRNKFQHLAARFAAKEAASKALGTGIGRTVQWTDIEVLHDERRRPILHLHRGAARLADKLGAKSFWVSLSHTADHAVATVVLEKP